MPVVSFRLSLDRCTAKPLFASSWALVGALVWGLALALPTAATAQDGARDFSPAEKLLFMTRQLGNLKPPTTLNYSFRKTGTMEAGFDDRVVLALKAAADGRCCAVHTDFLTAAQRMVLPDVPAADSNPVILHFLEREVREMQRLTKGSQLHFRKRIRMAVFNAATVRDLSLRYLGRAVPAKEIRITPYLEDPNRPRYEKLAVKEYRFLLSDAVPGGLFGIRAQINAADASAPALLIEELYLEGAEPASL